MEIEEKFTSKFEFWKYHNSCQLLSNQTIQEYCDKHKISISQFKQWRTRIKKEENSESSKTIFKQLTIPSKPSQLSKTSSLTINLPCGSTIVFNGIGND